MTATANHDQLLADWVNDVITKSGRQVSEVAEMLDMSRSSLSKIKGGQQQLKASQLLLLAEQLDAPLPRLTSAVVQDSASPKAVASFDRALFDKAHAYVIAENDKMPAADRMDQFQVLENTFHVYKTLMSGAGGRR